MLEIMGSNYKPFNRHIVIDKISEQKVSSTSGLLLTSRDTKKHVTDRGEITSVSDEASDVGLSVGNVVHYRKGRSFVVMINGEYKTLIRLEDVVIVE